MKARFSGFPDTVVLAESRSDIVLSRTESSEPCGTKLLLVLCCLAFGFDYFASALHFNQGVCWSRLSNSRITLGAVYFFIMEAPPLAVINNNNKHHLEHFGCIVLQQMSSAAPRRLRATPPPVACGHVSLKAPLVYPFRKR